MDLKNVLAELLEKAANKKSEQKTNAQTSTSNILAALRAQTSCDVQDNRPRSTVPIESPVLQVVRRLLKKHEDGESQQRRNELLSHLGLNHDPRDEHQKRQNNILNNLSEIFRTTPNLQTVPNLVPSSPDYAHSSNVMLQSASNEFDVVPYSISSVQNIPSEYHCESGWHSQPGYGSLWPTPYHAGTESQFQQTPYLDRQLSSSAASITALKNLAATSINIATIMNRDIDYITRHGVQGNQSMKEDRAARKRRPTTPNREDVGRRSQSRRSDQSRGGSPSARRSRHSVDSPPRDKRREKSMSSQKERQTTKRVSPSTNQRQGHIGVRELRCGSGEMNRQRRSNGKRDHRRGGSKEMNRQRRSSDEMGRRRDSSEMDRKCDRCEMASPPDRMDPNRIQEPRLEYNNPIMSRERQQPMIPVQQPSRGYSPPVFLGEQVPPQIASFNRQQQISGSNFRISKKIVEPPPSFRQTETNPLFPPATGQRFRVPLDLANLASENTLKFLRSTINEFRRIWRRSYPNEHVWNGFAYNFRTEARYQLSVMCNGEDSPAFVALAAYLDNKLAMKIHTGAQKSKRRKLKKTVLNGRRRRTKQPSPPPFDCHNGFHSDYRPNKKDLTLLQEINEIVMI